MFDKSEMNYLIEQAGIELDCGWDDDSAYAIAEAAFEQGHLVGRSEAQMVALRKQESIKKFLANLLDPEGLGHAVTQEVRENARTILKQLS